MKVRRLIQHRRVMISLLMCCLLVTLTACTVTLGSPHPGTPIDSNSGGNDASQAPQGTTVPLSRYLIIDSGTTYYALDAATGTVIWNLQNSSFSTTPVVANGQVYALKQAVSLLPTQGSGRLNAAYGLC